MFLLFMDLKIVYRVAVTNIFLSDVSFQPSQYFLSVLALEEGDVFPSPSLAYAR